MISAGAVANDGIAVKSGANNVEIRNKNPETTAVKPVRPPAATPEEDSTNVVTVEVPRTAPGEHLSGVAVNDLSRRGQDGPPPCALQQLQLQVPLQGVELLHHRRGREVELFRRLAEAAAVGHADKGGQLGVEHGRSSLPFKLLVDTMVQNRRFPVKPARLKIGANNRRWNIRLAGEEIAP